jgi:hypothetical protein
MPKQYGSESQHPLPPYMSLLLSKDDIKHVQKVVGSILYCAHAIDLTVLVTLSTIASKQAKGTDNTMQKQVRCLIIWSHTQTQWFDFMHQT